MALKHKIKAAIKSDDDLRSELQEKLERMDKITRLEKTLDYLLDDVQFYEVTQDRFRQDSELLFTIAIPDEMMPLIDKIETGCRTLGQICSDKITEGDTKREEERHVIDAKEYKELSESQKLAYERVLKGVNVKRFIVKWRNLYIKSLSETSEEPRLLIKDYSKKLTVAYEDEKFRCLRTIYCAYPRDSSVNTKYLLGLLNSTLLRFYYLAYFYSSRPGKGSFRFRKQFLKRLPIRYNNNALKEQVVKQVEEIISLERRLFNLESKVAQFPDSYLKDSWVLEKLLNKIKAQSLLRSSYAISEKSLRTDYRQRDLDGSETFKIILDTDEFISFHSEEIGSYVFEVLMNMNRITKHELFELRIPQQLPLKNLMSQYRKDREQIIENQKVVNELERQIDDLVYKLYNITYKERRIIEKYLSKF